MTTARIVYADGPSGSPTEPAKPEIRRLLTGYENTLSGMSTATSAVVIRGTRAALYDVSGDYDDDEIGLVTADDNLSYRGQYYLGSTPVKFADLPADIAQDAAESAEDYRDQAEDQKSLAVTAKQGAEAARDIAAGYASDAVSQGNVPILGTVAGMSAISVPAGITTLRVNGYAAPDDGSAALYNRVTSQPAHTGRFRSADRFLPNGTVSSANGGWWELNEIAPNIRMFGANPDGVTDSGAQLRNAIYYARYMRQMLVEGTPHPLFPRGCVMKVPPGQYLTSQRLPLFTMLQLIGDEEEYGTSTGQTRIRFTGTGQLWEFAPLSGDLGYSGNEAWRVVFKGISWIGPSDVSTYFVQDYSSVYPGGAIRYSKIEGCGFQYFKPIDATIVGCRIIANEFANMPFGNARFHGSDNFIEKNFFNGSQISGVVVSNAVHKSPLQGSGLFNSRIRDNYVTGAEEANSIHPIPAYFADCYDLTIEGNFLDLSDGPGVVFNNCHNINHHGSRLCKVGLNPPTVDRDGNAISGRYDCAVLYLGTTRDCKDGGHRFITIDNVIYPYRWHDGTHTGDFVIDRSTYDGYSPSVPLRASVTPTAGAKIACAESAEKIAQYTNTTGPNPLLFVVDQKFQLLASSAGSLNTQLPAAKAGRRIKCWNANSTYTIGLLVQSGDVFRGQSGMIRVRLTNTDVGKWMELVCIDNGTWEVTSNGTPTFANS